MTWYKVDDTLPFHTKTMMAGNAAMGLWVRAGAWSMQTLSDGHVPAQMARTMGTPREIAALVSAGFWHEVEGGYDFHDWAKVQRTKEQVEDDRHAAAERQRKTREAKRQQRESHQKSQRDITRDSHRESHDPDQTRPDQTSSSFGTTTSGSGSGPESPKPAGRKRPATRIPNDWTPNDKHVTFASQKQIDIDAEAQRFRLHAEANDRRQADWNASFRLWLDRAKPGTAPTRALPNVRDLEKPPPNATDDEIAQWYDRRRRRA